MERGGAAVELVLSMATISLFSIVTFELTKGYLAKSRAYRAARLVAWKTDRSADEGLGDAAPDVRGHFHGSEIGQVSATSSVEVGKTVLPLDQPPPSFPPMSFSAGPFGTIDAKGLPEFMVGQVDVRVGRVEVPLKGLRLFKTDPVPATHSVVLRTARDPNPTNPEGWKDIYPLIIIPPVLNNFF